MLNINISMLLNIKTHLEKKMRKIGPLYILISHVMPGGSWKTHQFFLKRMQSAILLKTKTLEARNPALNGH